MRRTIHIQHYRAACEHICFTGAAADLIAFLCHWEVGFILFLGKLAFAAGAGGVYLLHIELEAELKHVTPTE